MFQTLLKNLAGRVPGTVWVMLAGTDGVLLEAYSAAGSEDDELLAAEFAAALKACTRAATGAGSGNLQGAILVTDRGRLVVQTIVQDYFLLMFLEHEAHTGRALFEISRARPAMEAGLA